LGVLENYVWTIIRYFFILISFDFRNTDPVRLFVRSDFQLVFNDLNLSFFS